MHCNRNAHNSMTSRQQQLGPSVDDLFRVDMGVDLTSLQPEIQKCKRRFQKDLWNTICNNVLKDGDKKKEESSDKKKEESSDKKKEESSDKKRRNSQQETNTKSEDKPEQSEEPAEASKEESKPAEQEAQPESGEPGQEPASPSQEEPPAPVEDTPKQEDEEAGDNTNNYMYTRNWSNYSDQRDFQPRGSRRHGAFQQQRQPPPLPPQLPLWPLPSSTTAFLIGKRCQPPKMRRVSSVNSGLRHGYYVPPPPLVAPAKRPSRNSQQQQRQQQQQQQQFQGRQIQGQQFQGRQVQGQQAQNRQIQGSLIQANQNQGQGRTVYGSGQVQRQQTQGPQVQGRQVQGPQVQGRQVQGHQFQGRQVQGHQFQGRQVQGIQVQGPQVQQKFRTTTAGSGDEYCICGELSQFVSRIRPQEGVLDYRPGVSSTSGAFHSRYPAATNSSHFRSHSATSRREILGYCSEDQDLADEFTSPDGGLMLEGEFANVSDAIQDAQMFCQSGGYSVSSCCDSDTDTTTSFMANWDGETDSTLRSRQFVPLVVGNWWAHAYARQRASRG